MWLVRVSTLRDNVVLLLKKYRNTNPNNLHSSCSHWRHFDPTCITVPVSVLESLWSLKVYLSAFVPKQQGEQSVSGCVGIIIWCSSSCRVISRVFITVSKEELVVCKTSSHAKRLGQSRFPGIIVRTKEGRSSNLACDVLLILLESIFVISVEVWNDANVVFAAVILIKDVWKQMWHYYNCRLRDVDFLNLVVIYTWFYTTTFYWLFIEGTGSHLHDGEPVQLQIKFWAWSVRFIIFPFFSPSETIYIRCLLLLSSEHIDTIPRA